MWNNQRPHSSVLASASKDCKEASNLMLSWLCQSSPCTQAACQAARHSLKSSSATLSHSFLILIKPLEIRRACTVYDHWPPLQTPPPPPTHTHTHNLYEYVCVVVCGVRLCRVRSFTNLREVIDDRMHQGLHWLHRQGRSSLGRRGRKRLRRWRVGDRTVSI